MDGIFYLNSLDFRLKYLVMDVLFWDRRNSAEIKLSDLIKINLKQVTLQIDSDEFDSGEWQGQDKHPAYLHSETIGTLAYKSPKCKGYENWDAWLIEEDLIFLRLIHDSHKKDTADDVLRDWVTTLDSHGNCGPELIQRARKVLDGAK